MSVIDQGRIPASQRDAQSVAAANRDPNADLGFGSLAAREIRTRLLNRDGTFNARRTGLRFWESLSTYHYFLTITWGRFLTYVAISYVVSNAFFAAMYVLCGRDALSGAAHHTGPTEGFANAFFFSVHTLSTIGYGNLAPANFAANLVVTVESLIGLLGFALVAGIVFARFARPVAKIRFSEHAVIAPYGDITGFMFRIVNQKRSEMVELEAKLLLTRRCTDKAGDREFLPLKLERDRVTLFPLSWTIVHPIDESSPLFGITPEEMQSTDSEFLVMLNGFDETFSQTVHTRSSYKPEEVVWGAKFRSMFIRTDDERGDIGVDVRLIDEVEAVELKGLRA
jgi:inward rectifier potassium channel